MPMTLGTDSKKGGCELALLAFLGILRYLAAIS